MGALQSGRGSCRVCSLSPVNMGREPVAPGPKIDLGSRGAVFPILYRWRDIHSSLPLLTCLDTPVAIPRGGKSSTSDIWEPDSNPAPPCELGQLLSFCTSISWCGEMLSFLLGVYLGVQLLGHMVDLHLPSYKTAKQFSRAAAPFRIPTSSMWGFRCPHILTKSCHCLSFSL